MSRLKAPRGYRSVCCNDGFTITAALVEAMSGKSYIQFVQDEILTPLGMANTRYPLSAFPAGSYAKAYVKGAAKPQEFVNTFASGGVYSTADDMARIAMMFLSGGRVGTTRILSGASDDAHHPQLNGRDLDDLDIVERDGAEWTRFGSYMHQPVVSVPVLPNGATEGSRSAPMGTPSGVPC